MRTPISDRDYERLSAFVDGQLSSREKRKLEESIRLRPELQVELADIQRMKALLHMMPHRRAPRNFTLTQAMVGDFRTNSLQNRIIKFFPALSFASALATLALVASLLFQWLPGALPITAVSPMAKEVALQPTAAEDSSLSGKEGSSQLEGPPALLESADSEAAVESTAVVGLMEAPTAPAPEERNSANQVEATLPPMIIWNNAGEGVGGYAITEGNLPDQSAKGMGGGGGTDIPGPVLPVPNGVIIVPLEGINSIEQPQLAGEAEPFSQKDSNNQNNGPILGIPPADQGGEITDQFAWGAPSGDNQSLPSEQMPESRIKTTSPGAPIWILQVILAAVAILTGVTAFYIRRQR